MRLPPKARLSYQIVNSWSASPRFVDCTLFKSNRDWWMAGFGIAVSDRQRLELGRDAAVGFHTNLLARPDRERD